MSDEPRRLITTIERAADVLMLFTQVDRPDLGVTEIANKLQLSKAVVHRVLTTLAAKGFVEFKEETRRYQLGPGALRLGVAYSDRIDLRALTRPALRQLCDRSGETATMSLRYGHERIYVDQETPDREVKMTVPIGRSFPLHAGSSSKAFLAYLPENEQQSYLEDRELAQLTEETITDVAQLRKELVEIRERGYAVSYGERQAGAGSVAAPILDHRSEPTAVISICGPLDRFRSEIEPMASLLQATTAELSRRLGNPHQ